VRPGNGPNHGSSARRSTVARLHLMQEGPSRVKAIAIASAAVAAAAIAANGVNAASPRRPRRGARKTAL